MCVRIFESSQLEGDLTVCGGLPVLVKNRSFLGTTHPSSLSVADADLKNLWNENQIHFS